MPALAIINIPIMRTGVAKFACIKANLIAKTNSIFNLRYATENNLKLKNFLPHLQ
jgi:hypothetical protein